MEKPLGSLIYAVNLRRVHFALMLRSPVLNHMFLHLCTCVEHMSGATEALLLSIVQHRDNAARRKHDASSNRW